MSTLPTARDRLERKEAEFAALRDISQAIGAALDLDSTLQLITRKTAEVMAMDSCSIYLLDAGGEHLVLRATTGLAPESIGRARLRYGEGLTGTAARTGAAVFSSDAASDPRFVYVPGTREYAFRSLLAVPLRTAGRVLGAMNVQTTAVHEYAPDEIELLTVIADLAAGAIEKATLYDSMRRQIMELSTLAEASRTITSPLYLEEMLRLIVEMATGTLGARLCSLMLLDQETGELVLTASHRAGERYHGRPSLRIGEGIVGLVAQTGRPIVVPDVLADPRFVHKEMARGEGLRALLAVPLVVRDRVIGVFNCYMDAPHHFTPEEISLFSTLANQTALAIENSSLIVRSAVVREMHHRVKNNLQTIAMLLRLQLRDGREVSGREVLTETINRVLSIAAVHEILSVEGFRLINVRELLERVTHTVGQTMARPALRVDVAIEGDDLFMPSQQATSVALAVNELAQNALEHAFADRAAGRLRILLAQTDAEWIVEVCDDGVGLPPGTDPLATDNLGLKIVQALATEDLGGRFEVAPAPGGGTRAVMTIPRTRESAPGGAA
ncbi:MAG: GAF domain-containing protein [Armatimonadota bacterium]|nr:GAF domain-containing protein [Armatimonadota bacterium]MDR7423206.1 GAF domain-containing protein [Armatimonadota bacterium]MDR7454823.1 GAF domain-containing protein [Armatimonadota bacterium]MDR7495467.1 GAF domain-containing protein [Armatimonadota bacterium]MDR7510442.1 GAF domain-containing protein [Armatimonadota bacterium]